MNKNKNFSVRKVIEKNNVAGYVFALPFIIGFSAFIVVPMAMSLYFSFCDYNILSPEKWVGLKNYDGLFQDPKFWNSLKVTLKYAVFAVPLKLVFASGRTASAEGDASYPDLPGCLLSAFHHGRFSGSFCFVETAVYRGRPY